MSAFLAPGQVTRWSIRETGESEPAFDSRILMVTIDLFLGLAVP